MTSISSSSYDNLTDLQIFEFIVEFSNYNYTERLDGFYYIGKKGVHRLSRKHLIDEIKAIDLEFINN
jgi:hypothetical protein